MNSQAMSKQNKIDADDSQQAGIQVIARTSRIMRTLSAQPHGLSLAEIAARVDLPRSTVQRIVTALAAENIVEPAGPGGGFRLGPALGQMIYQTQADITMVIRPYLESISLDLAETVCLSRLSGRQTNIVDVVVGEQVLRVVVPIGVTGPLHISADGKAMLARMSDAEVIAWLGGELPPRTRNSKNLEQLLVELEETRRSGFAYDNEEYTEGISAVAVALDTYRGVCALTVIAPTSRLREKRKDYERALGEARPIIERLVGTPSR